MKKFLTLLVGAALFLPVAVMAGGYAFPDRFDLPAGATYAGSETCAECHDDIAESYAHAAHDPMLGLTVPGTAVSSCESCHGPGSLHVDEGGEGPIWGAEFLNSLGAEDRAALCLQCHTGLDHSWQDSPHAGSAASCVDCHADQVHFGGSILPRSQYRIEGEFCIQCHQEQVSDFRLPYRHRVLEGQMDCSECHSPHGEVIGVYGIGGENQMCLRCHEPMAGPFVFEHDAVQGEECIACHRPHGSINDKLLTQDNNSLCLQCHYQPDYPVIGAVNHSGPLSGTRRCYDCHSEVHGSNIDPKFSE